MSPTRPPRQHRRVLWILLVATLLLTGYVSGYVTLHWMRGRGLIANATAKNVEYTAFAPIMAYRHRDLPGARQLWNVCFHAFWWGRGQPVPPESQMIHDLYMKKDGNPFLPRRLKR